MLGTILRLVGEGRWFGEEWWLLLGEERVLLGEMSGVVSPVIRGLACFRKGC